MRIPRPRIFYGWWMTVAAALAMAMQGGLIHYGFSAYFTPLVTEFGWSRAQLSGVFSLSRLEGGLIAPVAGVFIDRVGPRRLLMGGLFMMGLGFLLLSRVDSLDVFSIHLDSLVMFYVIYALFIAIGSSFGPSATCLAAVGNWFIRRRSTAMGLVMCGFGIGGSLVVVVAYCIGQFGWRNMMVLAGLILWFVGIPLAALMRHRPEQYGQLPDDDHRRAEASAHGLASTAAASRHRLAGDVSFAPRQVLRMPVFWLLTINFSIRQMITSTVTLHTIPFLGDLGFSNETAAAVLSIIATSSVLARVLFGWAGDHYDKRVVMGVGLVLLTVAMLIMSQATELIHVIIYVPFYAMAYGGSVPLIPATLAEYFGRKNFGTVQGFASTVQMVGNICGPLFAGFVFDVTGSYRIAFILYSAASVVALAMLFFVRKPKESAAAAPVASEAAGGT